MKFINVFGAGRKLRETKRLLETSESKLAEERRRFQILNAGARNGSIIIDRDGVTIFAAPSVFDILGYTDAEAIHKNIRPLISQECQHRLDEAIANAGLRPGQLVSCEPVTVTHRDGSTRLIEASFCDLSSDPMIAGIVVNFADITSHTAISEKLRYANRLYSFISQINQTIVHTKDEHSLYESTCRIAVEQGEFEFAWIGMADQESGKINLQHSAGGTQLDFEYFEDYTYDIGGPIDIVLQGDEFSVISDIENKSNSNFVKYAHERGFKSAICLPLRKSGRAIGTVNLYSTIKHFFIPQEIALLKEATGDISFALDVFERDKQRTLAEQQLQYSENRLQQAQEIAHLGSWEVSLLTGVAIWSKEALRIYGIPESENVQSYGSWLSYIHPEDLNYVKAAMHENDRIRDKSAFFHRIVRRDGSVRFLYSQSNLEKNADGQPVALHGILHDVTNAKLTETALNVSQENLRIVVDSIPQVIFAKDVNHNIVFANKAFASIFGLSTTSLINKNILTLPRGEQLARFLESEIHGQSSILGELTLTDTHGSERIFHTTNIPYAIPGKPTQAVLVIASDITYQKIADQERSKMLSDIVQRNKDLEQFSFIVSHNLRAPVANIMGLTTELDDESHDADVKKVLQQQLSKSVHRLDNVIMDLNRILQLKTEIIEEKEEVNLNDLIVDIQSSLSGLIVGEQVTFDIDFKVVKLHTLKSYQYSIFYNLISNSIKYKQAEVAPIIQIRSEGTDAGVKIVFRDNGIGIDLSKKENHVFGLYKRFHSHVEGKGVGLFMVKTQVETLGGRISVDSEINSGTEFVIEYQL